MTGDPTHGGHAWSTATPGADVYAWTAVPGHDWSFRATGWGEGEAECSCGWASGITRTNGGDWVNHLPLYELGERASQKRLWAEVQRLHSILSVHGLLWDVWEGEHRG